jgi:tetratricopeptide (TPR) repeat protein
LGSEHDEIEVEESLRNLVQLNEQFKMVSASDERDLEDVNKLLTRISAEISKLAQLQLTTKKIVQKRLGKLELCREEMKIRIDFQQSELSELKETVKTFQLNEAKQMYLKLENPHEITSADLDEVNLLITKYPTEKPLYYIKAGILEALGKDSQMERFIQKLTKTEPKNYFMWYIAALYTTAEEKRLELFKTAVGLIGTNEYAKHSIYHYYASALLRNEEFDLALENINKSLEANTKCAGAWNLKAVILNKQGKFTEALGCTDTGLKFDKKKAQLWLTKGEALKGLGQGHSKEAIDCFDKGIELSLHDSTGYIVKALYLLDLERYDEALKTIDAGIKDDKKDYCMRCYKGCVLYEMDRPEEAIESFKKVFSLVGNLSSCPAAFEALVTTYGEYGHLKELKQLVHDIKDNGKVWDLIPNDTKAMLNNEIAWQFARNNIELGKALEMITDAISAYPEGIYYDTLGAVLYAMHKDNEALIAFTNAIEHKESDDEISWDILSALYTRLGREDDAKEMLAKVKGKKKSSLKSIIGSRVDRVD